MAKYYRACAEKKFKCKRVTRIGLGLGEHRPRLRKSEPDQNADKNTIFVTFFFSLGMVIVCPLFGNCFHIDTFPTWENDLFVDQ